MATLSSTEPTITGSLVLGGFATKTSEKNNSRGPMALEPPSERKLTQKRFVKPTVDTDDLPRRLLQAVGQQQKKRFGLIAW